MFHIRCVRCVRSSAALRIPDDVIIRCCVTPARVFATPRCGSLYPRKRMSPFEQTVDGLYLPVFRYTVIVDFLQQSVQAGSNPQLLLK